MLCAKKMLQDLLLLNVKMKGRIGGFGKTVATDADLWSIASKSFPHIDY